MILDFEYLRGGMIAMLFAMALLNLVLAARAVHAGHSEAAWGSTVAMIVCSGVGGWLLAIASAS